MKYDFDTVHSRRGTNSFKWDATAGQFGRPDVLPLWMADMDFACPQPILDAITRRTRHPVLGYSIRSEAYYRAVLGWLQGRHGWEVRREQLAFSPPGPMYAISKLVQLLSAPGDEIVVQTPAYMPLLDVVRRNQRVLLTNPLVLRAGEYRMDLAQLADLISPRTRVLLLCSPHNPSGRVWTREELQHLAEICRRNDVTVIADEVHCDLVYPGYRHIPFGSLPGRLTEQSITLMSPNKTFNTASLPQCTLVIPDNSMREGFQNALEVDSLTVDGCFAAEAMIAGYQHCADWPDQLMAYVADNFQLMQRYLAEQAADISCITPQGTYLAWLDFRNLGLPQAQLQQCLVAQGVGLFDGLEFGSEGDGFFRINLACPRSILQEALAAIVAASRQ